MARVGACGAAWGASQVLFGLGIRRAGVALGFTIVMGLAAGAGSLVPLWFLQSAGNAASGWQAVIAGILIILCGVAVCAQAGRLKDAAGAVQKGSSRTGILLCVGAGLGGSMVNIGMVEGAPLAAQAARAGVSALHRADAVWLPLLAAGFLTTTIYCGWLLTRNGTWHLFTADGLGRYWLLAGIMAVCWFGSVEVYGIGAARLGQWGPVLGWPIFLSASISSANIWGFATGEWRRAAVLPRRLMLTGVGLLITAIFVIGWAGRIEH